jgi:predicted HicB family RNase H-like nuclease
MKRYDDQVCLKLAGPLRAELEAEAAAHQRSLSSLIRTVLINHAAQRVVDRETQAA